MDKNKLLNLALIFVLGLLAFQLFGHKSEHAPTSTSDLEILAATEIKTGDALVLTLKNNTAEPIVIEDDCPAEPLTVKFYENGEWVDQVATLDRIDCSTEPLTIAANGGTLAVSYAPWQQQILNSEGRYRIELPVEEKVFFHEFVIEEPGFFGSIWRQLIYRPIYNALAGLTKLADYSFGWGIVLLTLAIRLILFIPFQKSLESQRKMQLIQPEIEAIKKKYGNNQQMIATETMALYKKYGVSPFGSCLPLLIQMPFLIAVFWITRGGLAANGYEFLYAFWRDSFDFFAVSTDFFGLDLFGPGSQFYFALPITLVVVQFAQMKLSMARTKKNQAGKATDPTAAAMQNMTKFMPYFLPAMIGFMAISMPAAVGIYWGTSTLFGVGQQLVVNRQLAKSGTKLQPKKSKEDEGVKVITVKNPKKKSK